MKTSILKKIVSRVLLVGCMLAFVNIASIVYGNQVVRVYFSSQPITCKGYLITKKRITERDSRWTSFLAKVQIVGHSSEKKKIGYNAARVRVVERLEGSVPAEQFNVQYFGENVFKGKSSDFYNDKQYFILGSILTERHSLEGFAGEIWKAGDVLLSPVSIKDMQADSWWEKFLAWFPSGLFSKCENVE